VGPVSSPYEEWHNQPSPQHPVQQVCLGVSWSAASPGSGLAVRIRVRCLSSPSSVQQCKYFHPKWRQNGDCVIHSGAGEAGKYHLLYLICKVNVVMVFVQLIRR